MDGHTSDRRSRPWSPSDPTHSEVRSELLIARLSLGTEGLSKDLGHFTTRSFCFHQDLGFWKMCNEHSVRASSSWSRHRDERGRDQIEEELPKKESWAAQRRMQVLRNGIQYT